MAIPFCDHDTQILEMVAFIALFRVHKSFEKLDGSWINHTKPSKQTFSRFFKLLWMNVTDNDFWIGQYKLNTEKRLYITKKLNSSMDHVALLCGMEAVSWQPGPLMTLYRKIHAKKNISVQTMQRVL